MDPELIFLLCTTSLGVLFFSASTMATSAVILGLSAEGLRRAETSYDRNASGGTGLWLELSWESLASKG